MSAAQADRIASPSRRGPGRFAALISVLIVSLLMADAGFAATDHDAAEDQYLESLPDSDEDKPTKDILAPGNPPQSSLPAGKTAALSGLGPDGRAAAALAGAVGSDEEGGGGSSSATPLGVELDQVPSPSPIAAIFGGEGGAGWVFPTLLVGALALGIAVLLRRRSDERGGPT